VTPGPAPAILGIDHVQLAMPAGGEAAARAFYGGLLGLPEIPKPAALAGRGGCWFGWPGGLQLHLGVDPAFAPARKAHVGLLVRDLAGLAARLESAGHATAGDAPLDGYERVFVNDPFGNRLELLERTES
jgi:catechol 2,3-dioxygenase-like lactoylglutathione lyase family enzyme